jgi:hypothetical protein
MFSLTDKNNQTRPDVVTHLLPIDHRDKGGRVGRGRVGADIEDGE